MMRKKPLQWLQTVRDYVSGRTSELDDLLDWVESQTEPITENVLLGIHGGSVPMQDRTTSLIDVAKQFWALLNPLVLDTPVEGTFQNCPGTMDLKRGGCWPSRSTMTRSLFRRSC